MYRSIPLETQTLYAELLSQLISLEAQRSIGSLPGSFSTKKVKGETYLYFQRYAPGGTREQIYLGRDSPELQQLREAFQQEKLDYQTDLQRIDMLCAQVRAGGGIFTSHAHYRVLKSFADTAIFRIRAVLVGTQAFATYGNILGVQWDRAGMQTQDIDVAFDRDLSLALPDLPKADIPDTLDQLKMGFFPVPEFDRKAISTSYKVRKSSLRVDILTPSKGRKEDYKSVQVSSFNAAAQALRYLNYLIEDPIQAAFVGTSSGVLINVPDPARYALHKLIVAQERPASEQVKANKDYKQASLLIRFLFEERPADLQLAWKKAGEKGKTWQEKILKGYAIMLRHGLSIPEAKDVLTS